MHIITIAGARPNFVKLAPLCWEFAKHPKIEHSIVHTGQHYDDAMSDSFFKALNIPAPKINLGVGSAPHGVQTGQIMIALEPVFQNLNPDWIITFGDVNSTMAASIVAVKLGIKCAHVEAGLRSFDRSMPEEINRIVTDSLSDLLFVSEQSGFDNLMHEGVDKSKVHFVGNIMIDTLIAMLPYAHSLNACANFNLTPNKYGVITLHRPSNVDDKNQLEDLCRALLKIADDIPLVMPLHPRTRENLKKFDLLLRLSSHKSITLIQPVDYLSFLSLVLQSQMVLTDSGGIQEETTYLGIPCFTIRRNTERPVTVDLGTNILVNPDSSSIIKAFQQFHQGRMKKGTIPPLWDGNTANRIVSILLSLDYPQRLLAYESIYNFRRISS